MRVRRCNLHKFMAYFWTTYSIFIYSENIKLVNIKLVDFWHNHILYKYGFISSKHGKTIIRTKNNLIIIERLCCPRLLLVFVPSYGVP